MIKRQTLLTAQCKLCLKKEQDTGNESAFRKKLERRGWVDGHCPACATRRSDTKRLYTCDTCGKQDGAYATTKDITHNRLRNLNWTIKKVYDKDDGTYKDIFTCDDCNEKVVECVECNGETHTNTFNNADLLQYLNDNQWGQWKNGEKHLVCPKCMERDR